ncbi:beta-lactamase family protein [Maribacter polysiphoniae]|uniref:Beta-lactamase n=1 Tax=Maribacter polysiphoniae TaxID=429344 RepID=A0A316DWX6_9FLAO|nr:serine hydrolase domain-containing protein [Maribacter polysiphoniae]MBD1261542.1 beta-lactamase family protein [Maribacter polysiphoniae]PWK22877.1 beta-lactamase [Maribacter polysiphoniae]
MKKLIILLVFNALLYQSYGQTNDSITKELTQALEQIYAQGHIIGFSVAVVNQDGIVFEKGLGYADRKKNIGYSENTIQNIASISKTFIGVALLKAQEIGKILIINTELEKDGIEEFIDIWKTLEDFENKL